MWPGPAKRRRVFTQAVDEGSLRWHEFTRWQCFLAMYFDRTSTNRIAEVAGVSVGSLYQYFPSKEALVVAVGERHRQEIARHV